MYVDETIQDAYKNLNLVNAVLFYIFWLLWYFLMFAEIYFMSISLLPIYIFFNTKNCSKMQSKYSKCGFVWKM